jgi:hypothetical protein
VFRINHQRIGTFFPTTPTSAQITSALV